MTNDELLLDDEYEEDEDLMEDMYLTFGVHDRNFGLNIRNVVEIVVLQHITEVPDMPKFVKGIVNLRGRVIPLIDIRERFYLPWEAYHERTCTIIIEFNNLQVGLIVDTVSEVLKIAKNQLEPSPRVGESYTSRFVESVAKVGDGVKIVLNLDRLLNEKEKEEIEQVSQAEPLEKPEEEKAEEKELAAT